MPLSLDRVANAATIIACVVVTGSITYTRWAPETSRPDHSPAIGQPMPRLDGLAYDKADRGTLLLYARSTCRYCTDSMTFYKSVARDIHGYRFVVVGNEPIADMAAYLNSHDFHPSQLVRDVANVSQVNGTPTLFLVDHDGKVIAKWLGKLNSDQEQEVLRKVSLVNVSR
jgi:hypothetical protein